MTIFGYLLIIIGLMSQAVWSDLKNTDQQEASLLAEKVQAPQIVVVNIASGLVDCVGVAPMQCMQIKFEDQSDWQFMYDRIEGFVADPAYEYRLRVKIVTKDHVPADASSQQWILMEILDQRKVDDDR